jgi:4-cresol dehydrogenase (hydroxylating)
MEVVLADGRVVETGFGHFEGAKARHVYPYGLGPSLDGLFAQSNLGIVTRMGVWLCPKPEAFQFFFVRVEEAAALEKLVEALRPLRMKGTLNSAVHIGNDLRIISALQSYPWEEAAGEVPLPESVRDHLREQNGVGAWNVSGALTGSRGHVKVAAKALRRAVGSFEQVTFVDDRKLALGQRVAGLLKRVGMGAKLSKQLEALVPNYGLLKGIPTNAPLRGTQWRLRKAAGIATDDPLKSGSGLLWISPILPLRGSDAKTVLSIVTEGMLAHGFDVLVTFTMLNERSMVGVFNIAYDKGMPEEYGAAKECYTVLMEKLIAAGYPPYRVNALGMTGLYGEDDTFWAVGQALKKALDEKDVIARGRYIPPLQK